MSWQVLGTLTLASAFLIGVRGKADKTFWVAVWITGVLSGVGVAAAAAIYIFGLPFQPIGDGWFVLQGEAWDVPYKITIGLVGGKYVHTLKGFCLLLGAESLGFAAALWLGFGLRRLGRLLVDLYYDLTPISGM